MVLRVDPANGLAIYDQIVRQVKYAVARGALKAGDRVPSVRELARELAINANTVARAYQQLQAEGVLRPVRGLGLEIAEGAATPCRQERQKLLQEQLRCVLREARQSGLAIDAVQQLVDRELHHLAREEHRS